MVDHQPYSEGRVVCVCVCTTYTIPFEVKISFKAFSKC